MNHDPQNQEGGNNDAVSDKQEWVLPHVTLIRHAESNVSCHTEHTWSKEKKENNGEICKGLKNAELPRRSRSRGPKSG